MIAQALLALVLAAPSDQTIQVKNGTRLEVRNVAGEVTVKVWSRDEVLLAANPSDRDMIDIHPGDKVLVVRGHGRNGPRSVGINLTIPSWMAVNVTTRIADVTLDGVGSDVSVETIGGDIHLRGGSGFISARSIQGGITIERAQGRIEAHAVNESLHLSEISGNVTVGTTNGSIALDRMKAANLEAYTINGGITYDGAFENGGSYRITTHNGLLSLAVPEQANATMMVRTFNGSFHSSFPVRMDNQERRNRFTLTLGAGSARVELESFNGAISLRRPGEPPPQSNRDRQRERNRLRRRGRVSPDFKLVPAPRPSARDDRER